MASSYGRNRSKAESFMWKGQSCKNFSVTMRSFPTRVAPAIYGISTEVSGRDGDLWTSDNTRKAYDLSIACSVSQSKITAVADWLRGSGELIFSKSPNEAVKARIQEEVVFARLNNDRDPLYGFEVRFKCQPFMYIRPAVEDIEVTTSSTTIVNPGTAASAPVIKITGSGDFDVMIGQQIVTLTGVSGGGIILNSELLDAFMYDGSDLANDKMTGDFFTLVPGSQDVAWSPAANVTKITITPNWRNL